MPLKEKALSYIHLPGIGPDDPKTEGSTEGQKYSIKYVQITGHHLPLDLNVLLPQRLLRLA